MSDTEIKDCTVVCCPLASVLHAYHGGLLLPSCILPCIHALVEMRSIPYCDIAAPIRHPYLLSYIILSSASRPQEFSDESLEFQRRISQRNGLSEETYLPPALHTLPPNVTMETAREEARMVLFGAVQDVLDRTGSPPQHWADSHCQCLCVALLLAGCVRAAASCLTLLAAPWLAVREWYAVWGDVSPHALPCASLGDA